MRVEWTTHAVADPTAISEYIEQDRSLETANRVIQNIYDAIQDLALMPNQGRPGRIAGTRELVIARLPYVVIYRVLPERIWVLNIVHGAQRWP